MKRLFVGVVACAMVLAMSCESQPAAKADAAPAASEAAAEPFSYEGTDITISIPENKPYNYQGLFEVPGWQPAKGESVTITIEGTSDVDIALLKCFLVENSSGWNVLSGYDDFSTSPIVAGEAFSFTHTTTTTAKATGAAGNKISFYVEFADTKSAPTLTLSKLSVSVK